jgi:hypothetical protein
MKKTRATNYRIRTPIVLNVLRQVGRVFPELKFRVRLDDWEQTAVWGPRILSATERDIHGKRTEDRVQIDVGGDRTACPCRAVRSQPRRSLSRA